MPNIPALSATAKPRRDNWLRQIVGISGNFGADSARVEAALTAEIDVDGAVALLDHLHLCGAIPETYGHDSSDEKLYSKYTDALLASVFRFIGMTSLVLAERADSADVEAVTEGYSFVADAKVFRLSRTAKNQKDFKVDAMAGWKRGKPHAVVVCPIYQLPSRASQIYFQAISRNVTILSYAHLGVLVRTHAELGGEAAISLLHSILTCTDNINPSKDALPYWTTINKAFIDFHPSVRALWAIEKLATIEAIALAKDEAQTLLAEERTRIMRMSKEEAIANLLSQKNIEGRLRVIGNVSDNGLL